MPKRGRMSVCPLAASFVAVAPFVSAAGGGSPSYGGKIIAKHLTFVFSFFGAFMFEVLHRADFVSFARF